jgi:acyl carrier protein
MRFYWCARHPARERHGDRTGAALELERDVRDILRDVLSLGTRADRLEPGSPLLGAIPELDSMAVVSVLAALEDRFGFSVDDDEVSGATFATLGSLVAFVSQKSATPA